MKDQMTQVGGETAGETDIDFETLTEGADVDADDRVFIPDFDIAAFLATRG